MCGFAARWRQLDLLAGWPPEGVWARIPAARCTNSRSGPRTGPKFVKIIPDKLC